MTVRGNDIYLSKLNNYNLLEELKMKMEENIPYRKLRELKPQCISQTS